MDKVLSTRVKLSFTLEFKQNEDEISANTERISTVILFGPDVQRFEEQNYPSVEYKSSVK